MLQLKRIPPGEERGLKVVLEGEYSLPEGFDPGENPIILDIGANVGAFTLWALHQWSGATVFCYEPNPQTFAYLKDNVADFGNVSPACCAVWLADGKMPLYLPKAGLPSGCCSLKDTGEVDTSKVGVVKVVHARNLPAADIVKLDTEGCELDILRAYPHLSSAKAVMLEWHSHADRAAIRDLMLSHGFELVQDTEWSYVGRGIQKFIKAKHQHLFIAVLSGGGQVWSEHEGSIDKLKQLAPQRGINLTLVKESSTGVDRARNKCIAAALKDESVTHFMFIDNDIVFDPQWVVNMVHSGLDVTAGAYPRKQIDWELVERAVKMGVSGDELAKYATSFIINHVVDSDKNGISFENIGDFVEVEEVGTGFLMFKREVIEKMLAAYSDDMAYVTDYPPRDETHHMLFACGPDPASGIEKALAALKKAAVGYWSGDKNATLGDFNFAGRAYADAVAGKKYARYLTEDYRWCRLWRMLGGKIYVYLEAAISHLGVFKFEGQIKNVLKRESKPAQAAVESEQMPGPV